MGLFCLDEMLPLEIKQSGGKLLPHSDLRGGVFPEGVSQSFKKRELAQERDRWRALVSTVKTLRVP
jgi:hypothetical protein